MPTSDNVCSADANSEINHSEIVEKVEDSTNDTIQIENEHTNDEEKITNTAESDWQAPVSLKGFKKKLNEIFTVKFVPQSLSNSFIFSQTTSKKTIIIAFSLYFFSRCTFSGCVYYFENDERRQMHERYD